MASTNLVSGAYIATYNKLDDSNLNRLVITTTTTLQGNLDVRCEGISTASEKTCMAGWCPAGYDCKYVPSLAAANKGYCKCISKETTTTTTLPAEIRCEAVTNPNEKTCMDKICPQGSKCKYAADVTGAPGKCLCVSYATTTTILTTNSCERTQNPSVRTCEQAVCPDGARCMLRPVLQQPSTFLAAVVTPTCVCVEYTTTTTLYPKCEGVSNPSQAMCLRGSCPPNKVCRYKPRIQQVASAGLAEANQAGATQENSMNMLNQENIATNVNLPTGSCECVPCECDTTTTTIPAPQCEAVRNPSANTCIAGICPRGYDCRFMQTPGVAAMGHCKCVESSTTTLPSQVLCEKVENPSSNTCEIAKCPAGQKCKAFTVTTGSTQVRKCACVSEATTTSIPPERACENVGSPSESTCEAGLCPAGQECRVVGYGTPNAVSYKCRCYEVGVTTSTTLLQPSCEGIANPSAQACVYGKCPEGLECKFNTNPNVATALIGKCSCVPKQAVTTTTLPQGILSSILRALFG